MQMQVNVREARGLGGEVLDESRKWWMPTVRCTEIPFYRATSFSYVGRCKIPKDPPTHGWRFQLRRKVG